MRLILDSDLLSILQQERQPQCDRLSSRLDAHTDDSVCTTVVNFQEQTLGWAAYLNRAKKPGEILKAYRELLLIESYYRDFEILPYEVAAQEHFERLRRAQVRIATLDLRIASIALAHSAKLLSRNLRDFKQVPGLVVEDWSK